MTRDSGKDAATDWTDTESGLAVSAGILAAVDRLKKNNLSAEQLMLGLEVDDAADAISEKHLMPAKPVSLPVTDAVSAKLQLDHAATSRRYYRFWLGWPLLWHGLAEHLLTALLLEYKRGTVFLLSTVAAGCGAIHYFAMRTEPIWTELFIPTLLLICLKYLLRETLMPRVMVVLVLFYIAGIAAGKWETQRYATPMVGSSVSTVLTARIVSMDQEADNNGKTGRWRVIADVLATERPQLRHAPQRLRLSARDLPAQTDIGSVIKGAVRLRPHGGAVRAGQYDFAFHGFFRAIGGNGFYLGVPKLQEATGWAEPQGLMPLVENMIGNLRALIGGRIMQALPGEAGAVSAALISGQRAGISEETNEALRIAGLAHVLSISGLHLALAAAIMMVSIRGIASFFPVLSLYYPVKKIAALISLFSSGFYLAMSGADVAAQRSFIMLAVMLCAVLINRQALTMRNLAIAGLFSIMATPHELLGPSFQMSYSATGALIAGYSWWRWRKKKRVEIKRPQKRNMVVKIGHSVLATIVTSLLAGTASGLFAAFHFNNMAPLGMLGNVLAMPVISLLIMPFALLALLLMPFNLEWFPLQVMGFGVEAMKWISHFVAAMSPDLIPGLLPPPVLLLWTVALIVLMLLSSFLRWLSVLLLALGAIVLGLTRMPDIVISEDARLVAVRDQDKLYVNRTRPSAFTVVNWSKAYQIREIRTPKAALKDGGKGFVCEDGLCSFDLPDGRLLSVAENSDSGETACRIGDIVVLAYAGDLSCQEFRSHKANAERNQTVITRQQLALKGVVEIYLSPHEKREPVTGFDAVEYNAQDIVPMNITVDITADVPQISVEAIDDPDGNMSGNAELVASSDSPSEYITQENQAEASDVFNSSEDEPDIVDAWYAMEAVDQDAENADTDSGSLIIPQNIMLDNQSLKSRMRVAHSTGQISNMQNIAQHNKSKAEAQADVVFAVGMPQRPWHLYRLYSRAARNEPER